MMLERGRRRGLLGAGRRKGGLRMVVVVLPLFVLFEVVVEGNVIVDKC